jgi:type I restriction enzyme, S subunit
MNSEWRESTWGNEIVLEYGKGIRGYSQERGSVRVFGTNGPIGWCDEALSPGPGVILGRKGAYRGVHYSNEPFYVIDTAYYVRPLTDLNMRWVYYALLHQRVGEIDDGSPIPSTTRSAVYALPTKIPCPVEQRAIAEVLGALDDKIEANCHMNATLEGIARAIFRSRATEDWPLTTVEELADIYDGPHATPEKTNAGPIFLGISELVDGNLNLSNVAHISEEDFARWTRRVTPQAGDIVFSYETRLGQCARIPRGLRCCLGRRMGLLRPKAGKVHGVLLLYAYLSAEFQEMIRLRTIHGSTVDRIPLVELGSFPIRMATFDAQKPLARVLAPFRERLDLNNETSHTLGSLRDLLLPKLMTGEIHVRDAERLIGKAGA